MRFRGNWMIGVECSLIAFILVLISLPGTWFSYQGTSYLGSIVSDLSEDWHYDFRLAEYDVFHTDRWGSKWYDTREYSEAIYDNRVMVLDDIGLITLALLVLALMFIMATFILAFLVGLGRIDRRKAAFAGTLAIFFTILGLAYFSIAFTSVMESDSGTTGLPTISGFWGSEIREVDHWIYDLEWGPGQSWYLVIFAFLLLLVGTIALHTPAKKQSSDDIVKEREPSQVSDDE